MTKASGGVSRRTLPVVRWLQAGSVAAGIGIALVAAPAVASADSGADSSPSGTGAAAARDAGDTVQRRGGPASNRPAAERGPRSAAPAATTTWARPSRPVRSEPAQEIEVVATEDSGIESPAGQAAVGASAHRSPARTAESRNSFARQDLPLAAQSAVNASPNTRAESVPAAAEAAVPALSSAVSDNYAPVVASPAPQAKATAAVRDWAGPEDSISAMTTPIRRAA
jgi:hypothetical protein